MDEDFNFLAASMNTELVTTLFQRQFCFKDVVVAISSRTEAKITCHPPETSTAHPTRPGDLKKLLFTPKGLDVSIFKAESISNG